MRRVITDNGLKRSGRGQPKLMVTSLLNCREQKVLDCLRRLIMKWILLIVASILAQLQRVDTMAEVIALQARAVRDG